MPIGFGSIGNLFSGFGLSSRNAPGQTSRYAGNFGNRRDKLNRPLAMRSSRTAENVWGFNNNFLDAIPQQKFLFYVKFMRPVTQPSQTSSSYSTSGTANDWSKGVGFVVKKIDRPSINFHLETLNQYNKIRKVQLRREYGDVTITFHDTHDMRVRHMFEEYFKYYYGDADRIAVGDWRADQTTHEFYGGESGWGYRMQKERQPNMTPFFSNIDIYQFSHGAYTITTLVNPYIISFDPDNLAYEEGSIGQEIQMKLGFEGILMNSALTALKPGDPLLQETMLDRADYYEPEYGPRARFGQMPSPWIPLRQPAGPDFLGGIFKGIGSAVLTGNTKNIGKVVTNSALDSFGYFDFNGVNVGGVLGSARDGGVGGAFGNILMGSDVPGAREVMTSPGGMGGSGGIGRTVGILGGAAVLGSVLNSNSDPNMQGGQGGVYVSGANGSSDWINPDNPTGSNINWNSTRVDPGSAGTVDISDMPWQQTPTQRAIGMERQMVDDERRFRESQGIDRTSAWRTPGFFGG